MRTLTKHGESYVVIQLPSGATQQVPKRWTDRCLPQPSPLAVPQFSVPSLRDLLDILKQIQNRPHHEEVPDGSSPDPVAHVFVRNPARADRAVGRPASPSSARATPGRDS